MELATRIKLALYRHFATTGARPDAETLARAIGTTREDVLEAFATLRARRLLVLEPEGAAIRMAPPFSGVPTPHAVESGGVRYFANCAWDALGIPAALRCAAIVRSRCEECGEPLRLEIGAEGPERSSWLFHCLVPAAHWWDDIVFT